jgi:GT2 family glycosyltransferase
VQDRYSQRFSLLNHDAEFNYSAMNNLAVEHASTDFVLLLNSGIEIVQADWLTRMVSHIQRQEVGIVGAKLMAPNTALIQHAGVVLGVNQVAGHPFSGELTIGDPGYMGRAQLDQNYSAVTGACMLVDRTLYRSIGGMNAQQLPLVFNDVDFCLRIQQKGFKVVWTPYALLVNHGDAVLHND